MSNVAFLKGYDQSLVDVFDKAEAYAHTDPSTSIFKVRQFAEMLAKYTAVKVGIAEWEASNQAELLKIFKIRGVFGTQTLDLFHNIRKAGNLAVHENNGTTSEALSQVKMAWYLALTFHRGFSKNSSFEATYKEPKLPTKIPKVDEYDQKIKEAEAEINALQEKLRTVETNIQAQATGYAQKSLQDIFKASSDLVIDELTTRKRLIDEQLRMAGWETDTLSIRYSKGSRPEKGKNKAIAEWPTQTGPVDYALFCGLKLVGLVEAKKKAKDIASDLGQAERYSKGIHGENEFEQFGPWGEHKAPFLFSTNGRPYLEQYKEKSGIWFLDARSNTNQSRPLMGWYKPEDLVALAKRNENVSNEKLKEEPISALPLRHYQAKAIESVENAIASGEREILVAMATGTGKTRTCIGLAYRLIKTERFNRILFLVDRTSLGGQAEDSFKEMKIDGTRTFSDIYDIKGLDAIAPETATRVHFATIQSLIQRILYASPDVEAISVAQYDCIVIDECHRGYTLDKELSDAEFEYRNEADYISKYRRVLEYFDAVKIGLTATPALHTTKIFGMPVFNYSYREAVVDGYLVDYQEPIKITTELSKDGIRWKKGETVKVYDPETSSIEELANVPDELEMEVDDFNTKVVTENFNKVVCETLVKHIEWNTYEKTLIFCARDDHADMVVRLLNEAYGEIDRDAIKKITSSIDKPNEKLKLFKNEKFPSIVVTVDLLTTGIDVPEICNIVFLRRVKSRILYEQMIGRATRLCDKIEKDHFKIYDAVNLYEALNPVSAMKAVTPSPTITFEELNEELRKATKESVKQHIIDQIVAKINSRKRSLKGEALEEFKALTDTESPDEFVEEVKNKGLTEKDWTLRFEQIARWLDRVRQEKQKQFISEHEDKLLSVEQGFGNAERPEDYIEEFSRFVKENINKIPALTIVAQRPKDLTREELRNLKIILDQQGFKEQTLQKAYQLKEKRNDEIAASIIGFVRREAIGDALIPFKERLDRAMKLIKSTHSFTPIQIKWLDRIQLQLEKEYVVDTKSLDEGAFANFGGLKQLNNEFDGNFLIILNEINELIWQETA
jgi:type I restriction enzyme, R subunit